MKKINQISPQEWLELIPLKIYDKEKNKSYLIISVSKEGIWYHDVFNCYDEDGWDDKINCPSFMSFNKISDNMELGIEPTEKQIIWLEKYYKMSKSMTKQEAYKIIKNYINKFIPKNLKSEYIKISFDTEDYDYYK